MDVTELSLLLNLFTLAAALTWAGCWLGCRLADCVRRRRKKPEPLLPF